MCKAEHGGRKSKLEVSKKKKFVCKTHECCTGCARNERRWSRLGLHTVVGDQNTMRPLSHLLCIVRPLAASARELDAWARPGWRKYGNRLPHAVGNAAPPSKGAAPPSSHQAALARPRRRTRSTCPCPPSCRSSCRLVVIWWSEPDTAPGGARGGQQTSESMHGSRAPSFCAPRSAS